MTLHLKQTATALAILGLSSAAAAASTVDTVVSIIETSTGGSSLTEDSATDAGVTVTTLGGSVATQNADGTSDVLAATGDNFLPTKVTSTAQFTQSETNTSGMSRDYTLSYDLTGQTANFNTEFFQADFSTTALSAPAVPATAPTNPDNPFINGAEELSTIISPFSGASFEYNIVVNDVLVFNARADALLDGFSPFASPVIDVESNFMASTGVTATGFSFSVGPIADSIFLGAFEDGETIEVVSSLTARAYTPGSGLIDGFPIAVNTFSSDPIKLSSVGVLTSTPTTPTVPPVPLPAAGWMLIAGLGGLAATRRRKT